MDSGSISQVAPSKERNILGPFIIKVNLSI
jgi:hypothetical protein